MCDFESCRSCVFRNEGIYNVGAFEMGTCLLAGTIKLDAALQCSSFRCKYSRGFPCQKCIDKHRAMRRDVAGA